MITILLTIFIGIPIFVGLCDIISDAFVKEDKKDYYDWLDENAKHIYYNK